MPRFTIDGDPISVAFGYEDDPGLANVFLSVYDKRLEHDCAASDAVNDVTRKVGDGDGGGCYFDLHTQTGFGVKVDHATMAVYLQRFGVPQDQIDALPLNCVKPSWARRAAEAAAFRAAAPQGVCAVCGKPGTKKCGKCHSMMYLRPPKPTCLFHNVVCFWFRSPKENCCFHVLGASEVLL